MIHPVPSSGRPKPPFGEFYEPATRRSRGLAQSARLGGEGQFEVIVGFYVLIGLMRGPTDQPPPAPHTPASTCRNRSPPWYSPGPASPGG